MFVKQAIRRRPGRPQPRRLRIENLEVRAMLSAAATFLSKTIADHTVIGLDTSFTQSFALRNSGTTTWSGYSLVLFSAGDHLGSPASIAIAPGASVAPGATVTVSVPLQATISYANEGASTVGVLADRDPRRRGGAVARHVLHQFQRHSQESRVDGDHRQSAERPEPGRP